MAAVTAVAGCALGLFSAPAGGADIPTTITVDGSAPGPSFQGIGAISGGGGNARLLIDYPAAQRSAILDFLFRPGYGAALQMLKLEIGGDADSSDGAEPSIEHTRGKIDCRAGYEWWLARQALARNPSIAIFGLQWAAPGWTGTWTSTDIHYIVDWLRCASSQGVPVRYVGGWNERAGYTPQWYISLRRALDAAGYARVEIVATDLLPSPTQWEIANDMASDPVLASAIGVIGVHDSCGWFPTNGLRCTSTAVARSLGKPLWESEIGAMDGNTGAPAMVRSINNAFIDARITGLIEWPLLDAIPAGLPYENRGLVTADQPWSGNFTVNRITWAIAQTTQFVAPGWLHLSGASGPLGDGGTYAAYEAPDHSGWSLVTETTTASAPQTIVVHLAGGLASSVVHVWATNIESADPSTWFVHETDIQPAGGTFTYVLPPGHAVTFSTTTGQGKGAPTVPSSAPMAPSYGGAPALPAAAVPTGRQTPLLATQDGAFQYGPCGRGTGLECLQQQAIGTPIWWEKHAGNPYAVLGDSWSRPYTVAVRVAFTAAGQTAGVIGDFQSQAGPAQPQNFAGYELELSQAGAWRVVRNSPSGHRVTLAWGQGKALAVGSWHWLALTVNRGPVQVAIDGRQVGGAADSRYSQGLAGIMTAGFYDVRFRDLTVHSG